MLKTILNLEGARLLNDEEQKNITGKGPNDPKPVERCKTYAPPGANRIDYPFYPCADIIRENPFPIDDPCVGLGC